jgi:hypothetical protein
VPEKTVYLKCNCKEEEWKENILKTNIKSMVVSIQ